jgi:hypothetical protein
VTSVGNYAFSNFGVLRTVTFLGDEPTAIGTDAFIDNVRLGAIAQVKRDATGFADDGELWEGLIVRRVLK